MDSFKCVGFQHNLQSNQCRLLDAKFIARSSKSSIRSFWITFQRNSENSTVIPEIPITRPIGIYKLSSFELNILITSKCFSGDVLVNTENEGREFDGFKEVSTPSLLKLTGIHLLFLSERNAKLVFHLVYYVVLNKKTFEINHQDDIFIDYMRSSATCGKRNVNFEAPRPSSSRLGRVVNGVDAPVGAIPWQVIN